MTDQNVKGCWQTPEQLSQNRKQNNSTGERWKQGVASALSLSLGCLLELGKLSYLLWKRTDRYLMVIIWYAPGSTNESWLFYLVIWSFLIGIRATIPHLIEGMKGLLLTPVVIIFHHKKAWYDTNPIKKEVSLSKGGRALAGSKDDVTDDCWGKPDFSRSLS